MRIITRRVSVLSVVAVVAVVLSLLPNSSWAANYYPDPCQNGMVTVGGNLGWGLIDRSGLQIRGGALPSLKVEVFGDSCESGPSKVPVSTLLGSQVGSGGYGRFFLDVPVAIYGNQSDLDKRLRVRVDLPKATENVLTPSGYWLGPRSGYWLGSSAAAGVSDPHIRLSMNMDGSVTAYAGFKTLSLPVDPKLCPKSLKVGDTFAKYGAWIDFSALGFGPATTLQIWDGPSEKWIYAAAMAQPRKPKPKNKLEGGYRAIWNNSIQRYFRATYDDRCYSNTVQVQFSN